MSTFSRNIPSVAREALAAVIECAGRDFDIRERTADALLELAIRPDGPTIVATSVDRPTAATLRETWHRLRALDRDVIPVVVVPHLPNSARDIVEEDRINWVDLAGNAHIAAPQLLVHIEGRRPSRVRLTTGVDPFAGRSANVVRQLLVEPERIWRQRELVDATAISQPQASKVLAALQDMALVRKAEDGFRVVDRAGLLDAWADAYRYGRNDIVPVHLNGEGIGLARTLHERLRAADVQHWFTGLPAAWAYDGFARFRLVSVFVDADPDLVRRDADLHATGRGANVHLIARGDQRVEAGQAEAEAIPCVHPVQVYVDLLGLAGACGGGRRAPPAARTGNGGP